LWYARKDLEFAQGLITRLRTAGESVWYDIDGVFGDRRWDDAVQDALGRFIWDDRHPVPEFS